MTARSHQSIRLGLRKIIRDPNVSVKARLEAVKLLMRVEGLMEEARQSALPENQPASYQVSEHNAKSFRELLAMTQEQKPE